MGGLRFPLAGAYAVICFGFALYSGLVAFLVGAFATASLKLEGCGEAACVFPDS